MLRASQASAKPAAPRKSQSLKTRRTQTRAKAITNDRRSSVMFRDSWFL
jgi:hypothetical protein